MQDAFGAVSSSFCQDALFNNKILRFQDAFFIAEISGIRICFQCQTLA
jgi:hypothetical protein